MIDLAKKHCEACSAETPRVPPATVATLLSELPGWKAAADGKSITKRYDFANFHDTMAFVNAVAFIAHREDHHPDLEVSYSRCTVRYSTHAIDGLSDNDFICAAKVESLLA